jgi:general secretion pathway protein G
VRSRVAQRGFTLIELVVTVAIVGVLALGAMPLAELTVQRTKEHDLRLALRQIRGAIDDYKRASDEGRIARAADATGYPPSIDVLVAGVPDARDPGKRPIYFLRRMPRDPFHEDATLPPAQTWGLRSYASPPDDPQPGKDVFDVYSQTARKAIDGTPLSEW